MRRTTYALLAGLALAAGGIWMLYEAHQHAVRLFPHADPALAVYIEREDLAIPALLGVVTLAIGVRLIVHASQPQGSALQRWGFALLALGLAIAGAVVGIHGLVGWITFAQNDSPFDDFAGMVIIPLATQAILGFLVALGAIISICLSSARIEIFVVFDDVDRSTP